MKDKQSRVPSIRFYILVILLAFGLLVFGSVWVFQNFMMDKINARMKTEFVQDAADRIATTVQQYTLDKKLIADEQFSNAAQSISREADSCALVINLNNGFYMGMGGREGSCPLMGVTGFGFQTLYNAAAENGGSILLYADGSEVLDINEMKTKPEGDDEEQAIVYVKNTQDKDGHDAAIILSTVIRPVTVVRDIMGQQTFYIVIIVMVLTIALSLVLSRIVARPIRKINEQAKGLAKGKYDLKFDERHGYREVTQLAGTLNYTATELSKVEQMRNDLIANVSHDLRTPLTMISGYGEVIRDIPGENTPENVQVIIDEANRLTDMVNNLLDLSKLQSGAVPIETTVFNLTDLLEEIADRYNRMVAQDGFTIIKETDKPVNVLADRTRISEVIYNLLNNAVNYSTDDKRIVLRQTNLDNERVRVDVIDHGMGVKKEELPYIWDRYYRVDKEHKRAAKGSGLGLSIVKTVLEKHQAEYGADSEYGKGSDFWFVLRIQPENENEEHKDK